MLFGNHPAFVFVIDLMATVFYSSTYVEGCFDPILILITFLELFLRSTYEAPRLIS